MPFELPEFMKNSTLTGAWDAIENATSSITGLNSPKSENIAPVEPPLPLPVEELPVSCNFDMTCTLEELMHRACMAQAHYCRCMQGNLERTRQSLMELYSGENRKQCGTYATSGTKRWKYLGAALHVGSAIIPFTGVNNAGAVAQGVSGAGSASGSVGDVWEQHHTGKRSGYQHSEGNYRRFLEQNDRSFSNAYSQIDVLTRFFAEIINKAHQSKTEMVR